MIMLGISTVAFSPNGKYLASGSLDNIIKIWLLNNNRFDLIQRLVGNSDHGNNVNSVVFSPDSQYIASTASGDRYVKIGKIHNNQIKHHQSLQIPKNDGHCYILYSVSFSPDSNLLIVGSEDTTIQIWQRNNDQFSLLHILKGHKNHVHQAIFSPDGKYILSASKDKTIKLWQINNKQFTCLQTLEGHKSSVNSVAFFQDSNHIVSVSDDKTLKIWKNQAIQLTAKQKSKLGKRKTC